MASKDFIRAELRTLLETLDQRDELEHAQQREEAAAVLDGKRARVD
jgi:Arc/MetJ-type ribon-helix-helix transcriptional regulator